MHKKCLNESASRLKRSERNFFTEFIWMFMQMSTIEENSNDSMREILMLMRWKRSNIFFPIISLWNVNKLFMTWIYLDADDSRHEEKILRHKLLIHERTLAILINMAYSHPSIYPRNSEFIKLNWFLWVSDLLQY